VGLRDFAGQATARGLRAGTDPGHVLLSGGGDLLMLLGDVSVDLVALLRE
jgi:hypothetical protein